MVATLLDEPEYYLNPFSKRPTDLLAILDAGYRRGAYAVIIATEPIINEVVEQGSDGGSETTCLQKRHTQPTVNLATPIDLAESVLKVIPSLAILGRPVLKPPTILTCRTHHACIQAFCSILVCLSR